MTRPTPRPHGSTNATWRGRSSPRRHLWTRQARGLSDGEPFSLRWLLIYMIAEYARYNGHADLLRERIDGRTGR